MREERDGERGQWKRRYNDVRDQGERERGEREGREWRSDEEEVERD